MCWLSEVSAPLHSPPQSSAVPLPPRETQEQTAHVHNSDTKDSRWSPNLLEINTQHIVSHLQIIPLLLCLRA